MYGNFGCDAREYPTVCAKVTNCWSGSLQGSSELRIVDRSPKDRGELLRGAKQIDVLADEAGIDRGLEAALLGRHIRHALAMRDIDEVERRGGDEVLKAGLRADIVLQMGQ